MNNIEFTDYIRRQLVSSTIEGIKSNLISPAGRQPHEKHIAMSQWYNSKDENDKHHVDAIIKETVETAIFGCLCVLDGVTGMDKEFPNGKFELFFTQNNSSKLINDPNEQYLHDLFNEE